MSMQNIMLQTRQCRDLFTGHLHEQSDSNWSNRINCTF